MRDYYCMISCGSVAFVVLAVRGKLRTSKEHEPRTPIHHKQRPSEASDQIRGLDLDARQTGGA